MAAAEKKVRLSDSRYDLKSGSVNCSYGIFVPQGRARRDSNEGRFAEIVTVNHSQKRGWLVSGQGGQEEPDDHATVSRGGRREVRRDKRIDARP